MDNIMNQTKTETKLPSMPNNKSQSQLNNNQSTSYCLTTPNNSTRNTKNKHYSKTMQKNYSQEQSASKDELNELMNKYKIPTSYNIIDEIDQILIDKLKIEYKSLHKHYMKSIGKFYDKENEALNAEKSQKESEEKANQLLKQKKVLIQKNYKLRETIGNLSVALSNAQREADRLKGVIEKDKAYSKELNSLFDSKLVIEKTKQKPNIIELNYLTAEKENLLSSIEQMKEGEIKKSKEMKKRRIASSITVKKPKHLRNQLTAKELSDMASDLTLELDDLKEQLNQCVIQKHSMNEQLKDQQKKLDKQKETIENLNKIFEEKKRIAHWNLLVLNKKNNYLNTMSNQTNYQSMNIMITNSNVNPKQSAFILKRSKVTE